MVALSIATLNLIALSIECGYAEYHLCRMAFMQSVTNKPFMLTAIKLNVVMLNVVAPQKELVANKHSSLFLLSPPVTKKKVLKHRSTKDIQQCDSDVCSSGVNLIKLFCQKRFGKIS
jgi:hypothetical protein